MKRQLAIIIMVMMVLTIMSAFASCEPAHIHQLTKFDKTEATCTLTGNEEYYKCSECGEMFSDALAKNPIAAPEVLERADHVDADKNHKCDDCFNIVGSHFAAEGSHKCGYCGTELTLCVDDNLDHKCDVCKLPMGTHEAAKGKHTCNYCGQKVTECVDADDHICDVCGETLGGCVDADKDHVCDVCGAEVGAHESLTGGHNCDYCGAPVTECVDDDLNHECEICGGAVGEHVEGWGHTCEYCWLDVSTCYDNDLDHYCDICFEKMGVHKPSKDGHFCEYCGYRYTPCVPYEDDGDCTTPVRCTVCEEILVEGLGHAWDWTVDEIGHSATCDNVGCTKVVERADHYRYEEGKCVCGFTCEDQCDVCDGCLDESCILCNDKCQFIDMNKVITFAPQANYLGAPEGPDGKAPGTAGAYNYDTSITAKYIVLPNGAKATLVTLPNGTTAFSGVSFWNNQLYNESGKDGFNCGIPLIDGQYTAVRMHFTNTGDSEVTFKFSNIDYYYDYGVAEVTLAAGETKTVLIHTSHGNSVGLNSQIVFTKDAAAGASVAMWGEFVANENLASITVATPANKLQFTIGETFSLEGLVLKANGTNFGRVYITDNFVTNLDGHVFTAEDVGVKAVIVEFAGQLTYYTIEVADHIHNIEYVPEIAPVACEKDGFEAHYKCTVDGCGLYFNDETGSKVVAAPKAISCHAAGDYSKVLPGQTIPCANCGAAAGVRDMTNWVLFNITTTVNTIGSDVKNAKLEKIELNGIPATKVYLGAGTKGGTGNNDIYLKMSSNDGDRQTVIPHLGSNAASGTTRTVILYYENYGSEPITMNLQNDSGSANGMCKVTVPAHGTAIGTFSTAHKGGGSNWYHYYVDSSHNTDVSFAVYGYMYINDSEVTNAVSVSNSAEKVVYSVGETFTSEGLVLSTAIPGSKTILARTGYTTNYDGHTFTADDIGTKTVTVNFAGKTVTYQITVKDANNKCDEGIHEYVFSNNEALFVEMNGADAMYKKACKYCGEVSAEAYAAPKASFVPHHNIGGGHTIEYVTLEDGRIAAKLTFTSNVAAGTTYTITANSYPGGTNVVFPVSGNGRRVYFEMTSSADITLTWQPEFYGDRDGFTFDLKAGETANGNRIIKYDTNASYTSSDRPYQEIVCNSAVQAGTVVYLTGYFYAPGDVTAVTVNTPANQVIYKVGETFSSTGLSLKPSSANALYAKAVIYGATTDFDGYTFTADDAGKYFEVTATFGEASTVFYIKVQG